MKLSTLCPLMIACAVITPLAHAQLISYSQNFEDLVMDDFQALSGDGWEVFGFVYDGDPAFPPNGNVRFPYGPFPAPNASAPGVQAAFSAIGTGAAGTAQGLQYLNAFSDYECCGGGLGHRDESMPYDRVQSIVFQTQEIAATDIGSTWAFSFDGRNATNDMGIPNGCDTDGTSDCTAFIKTIDPISGFQTNLVPFDSSTLSNSEWTRHTLQIDLTDPLLEGQLLQFGFESVSQQFRNTGVYYDNLVFAVPGDLDCDFDDNQVCNIDDADQLTMAVSMMSPDLTFDLNGDDVVNAADIGEWLEQAGADPSNVAVTGGNPFLNGDANLDGVVDDEDFMIWDENKFDPTAKYSLADFNGDGTTDGRDFLAWNVNKFQSSMGGGFAAVPEPSGALVLLVGFLSQWACRRRAVK